MNKAKWKYGNVYRFPSALRGLGVGMTKNDDWNSAKRLGGVVAVYRIPANQAAADILQAEHEERNA